MHTTNVFFLWFYLFSSGRNLLWEMLLCEIGRWQFNSWTAMCRTWTPELYFSVSHYAVTAWIVGNVCFCCLGVASAWQLHYVLLHCVVSGIIWITTSYLSFLPASMAATFCPTDPPLRCGDFNRRLCLFLATFTYSHSHFIFVAYRYHSHLLHVLPHKNCHISWVVAAVPSCLQFLIPRYRRKWSTLNQYLIRWCSDERNKRYILFTLFWCGSLFVGGPLKTNEERLPDHFCSLVCQVFHRMMMSQSFWKCDAGLTCLVVQQSSWQICFMFTGERWEWKIEKCCIHGTGKCENCTGAGTKCF
jgi:hypothetical protein